MNKKRRNPRSKKIYREFIVDDKFDPFNPSDKLEEELHGWKLPSSRYIAKEFRGKSIGSLNVEVASYIAFEAVMGSPEIRLLAGIRYYILFAQDEDVSKQEVYDEIIDLSDFGIIAEINAKHLKEKWGL